MVDGQSAASRPSVEESKVLRFIVTKVVKLVGSRGTKESTADVFTKLANVLPTGTFLLLQVLAPLATNNGDCHGTEKVVTAISILVLSLVCFFTSFTDSCKDKNGTVYYGFVTTRGMWNPNFRTANIAGVKGCMFTGLSSADKKKYTLKFSDFVNAAISVTALVVVSLLTPPITTCLYPGITTSIVKSIPLVGLVLSVIAISGFKTNCRHGIGFALAPAGTSLDSETITTSLKTFISNVPPS
jgi:hypothetical protein